MIFKLFLVDLYVYNNDTKKILNIIIKYSNTTSLCIKNYKCVNTQIVKNGLYYEEMDVKDIEV